MISFLPATLRPHSLVQAMAPTLRRLLAHVSETARQPDDSLAQAFSGLVAAVESAFRHEEKVMEDAACPGLRAQRENNALLLCALHRADARVACGNAALGREVIAVLPGLLALHGRAAPGVPHDSGGGERGGVLTGVLLRDGLDHLPAALRRWPRQGR